MNFEITEDQQRRQQAARDFASRVLAPRAADVDRHGRLDTETITQLGKVGWLGLTIPETNGGSDGDYVSLALAVEELAAGCANTAAFVAANIVVARALATFGNETQKGELLAALIRGQTTAAFASIDPDNLASGVLEARRRDDGTFELRGETGLVTLFGQPEHVIVFARVADEQIAAFVVPSASLNLHATVLPTSLGKRAANLGTLRLDGLHVPEAAMLGPVDAGLTIAQSALADGRILAAAESLGIARAAYERAVSHVKHALPKSTEPGLLGVQVMLADMCVEIEAARLLTLRAAGQADAEVASGAERSMARLFASEMSSRVAHKAMQIHGARHVATTPNLERHFRDARMTELSDDGLETQRSIIGRTMLKA